MPTAELRLPPEPQSVGTARRWLRGLLDEWQVVDLEFAGAQGLSELATNAVIHARTPYTIVVTRDRDVVRVAVHDLSAVNPRRRAYGVDATTGRGLRLVATLASSWGIDSETGGKVVWFEVPAEGSQEVAGWYADIDVEALVNAFDEGDAAALRSQLQW